MHLLPFCTLVIGGTFVATAAMAAATQVNIADPTVPSRTAKVDVGNRLAVQEVAPATYFHGFTELTTAGQCVVIATPPAGKALIIRQLRADVFAVSSPGFQQYIAFFNDNTCSNPVGDINPPAVGLSTLTFDPGLAIPNGSVLSAMVAGTVGADISVDAYKVDSSVAPLAGGQTIEASGKPQR